jgi:glycosyltransferase involved in cell wall biosynthesis
MSSDPTIKVLTSLLAQERECPPFEIVVVDDGSDDNTGHMVGGSP